MSRVRRFTLLWKTKTLTVKVGRLEAHVELLSGVRHGSLRVTWGIKR